MSIAGKYDLATSEKYDEFLKSIDVGLIKRNVVTRLNPTMEWIDHGNGKWSQNIYSAWKNFLLTFNVGEEIDDKEINDDSTGKSIFTLNGNVLTQLYTCEKYQVETVNVFSATEVVSTLTPKNVAKPITSKRVFKKQ